MSKSQEHKEGTVAAKPREHFQAIPSPANEYFLFPDKPIATYRHSCALVRKVRPDVVVIEGLILPNPNRSNIHNGQYCNLFFRPWTLLKGDATVPHITLLGLDEASLRMLNETPAVQVPKAAKSEKGKHVVEAVADKIPWVNTWSEYVRGNIVIKSAARIIQSFLLNTFASSSPNTDDIEREADATEDEREIPPLKLSSQQFGNLLRPATDTSAPLEEKDTKKDTAGSKLKESLLKRQCRLHEYEKATG